MNRQHNRAFFKIQAAMGTDDYFESSGVRGPLDLVKFTSKLTALATSSAGVTQLCSTQDRITRFLSEQLEKLEKESKVDDTLYLRERLTFTVELLRAERQHNEYVRAAAAAQVQMVGRSSLFFFHPRVYAELCLGILSHSPKRQ